MCKRIYVGFCLAVWSAFPDAVQAESVLDALATPDAEVSVSWHAVLEWLLGTVATVGALAAVEWYKEKRKELRERVSELRDSTDFVAAVTRLIGQSAEQIRASIDLQEVAGEVLAEFEVLAADVCACPTIWKSAWGLREYLQLQRIVECCGPQIAEWRHNVMPPGQLPVALRHKRFFSKALKAFRIKLRK